MAELPRFSPPSIWIVKVTAWSKKPFADFPGRFSGGLMGKRGRDAEVSVGVSHQWVRGAATSVAPDVTGTILSGRTSQVLGRSEGHGEGLCSRGSFSQLLWCVHPPPRPREGRGRVASTPAAALAGSPGESHSLSSGWSKERISMNLAFLPKKGKGKKKIIKKQPTPARLHINQGNKTACGRDQIIRSKSI